MECKARKTTQKPADVRTAAEDWIDGWLDLWIIGIIGAPTTIRKKIGGLIHFDLVGFGLIPRSNPRWIQATEAMFDETPNACRFGFRNDMSEHCSSAFASLRRDK